MCRGRVLDGAVNTYCYASIGNENSPHLVHCSRAVREELQSELAKDQIERRRRERQCESTPLKPFNHRPCGSRKRASDGKHPSVYVYSDHLARSHSFSGN